MTEQESNVEEAVSVEEKPEEAPKEVVSREALLEKIERRETLEALKDLVCYVDARSKDVVAELIAPLNEEIKGMGVVLKMVETDIVEIKRVVPAVEFSKEDRAEIIKAFLEVHKKLGEALATLSAHEIGYKTLFDTKRGILTVRLWKIADAP